MSIRCRDVVSSGFSQRRHGPERLAGTRWDGRSYCRTSDALHCRCLPWNTPGLFNPPLRPCLSALPRSSYRGSMATSSPHRNRSNHDRRNQHAGASAGGTSTPSRRTAPAEHTTLRAASGNAGANYEEQFHGRATKSQLIWARYSKKPGRRSSQARNGLNCSGNTSRTSSRPENSGSPSLSGTSANATPNERQSREPSVRLKLSASGRRLTSSASRGRKAPSRTSTR